MRAAAERPTDPPRAEELLGQKREARPASGFCAPRPLRPGLCQCSHGNGAPDGARFARSRGQRVEVVAMVPVKGSGYWFLLWRIFFSYFPDFIFTKALCIRGNLLVRRF